MLLSAVELEAVHLEDAIIVELGKAVLIFSEVAGVTVPFSLVLSVEILPVLIVSSKSTREIGAFVATV